MVQRRSIMIFKLVISCYVSEFFLEILKRNCFFQFFFSIEISDLLRFVSFEDTYIIRLISQHPMFRLNHGLILIQNRLKFILNWIISVEQSQISVVIYYPIIIFRITFSIVSRYILKSFTIIEDIRFFIVIYKRIEFVSDFLWAYLVVLLYKVIRKLISVFKILSRRQGLLIFWK